MTLELRNHTQFSHSLFCNVSDLSLDERAEILSLSPQVIVQDTESNRRACHKNAVIHVFRRCRRGRGPKTPEEDEDDVEAGEGVVDRIQNAGNAPWTPHETFLYDIVAVAVVINDVLVCTVRGSGRWCRV